MRAFRVQPEVGILVSLIETGQSKFGFAVEPNRLHLMIESRFGTIQQRVASRQADSFESGQPLCRSKQ